MQKFIISKQIQVKRESEKATTIKKIKNSQKNKLYFYLRPHVGIEMSRWCFLSMFFFISCKSTTTTTLGKGMRTQSFSVHDEEIGEECEKNNEKKKKNERII